MSCQLKVGGLYKSPRYHVGLFNCKATIQKVLHFYHRSHGVVNSYGMFYIPSGRELLLSPETPFTLFQVERVRNKRRGIVHLFKILTITGQMGWICLFVPNDCKELKA